MDTMMGMAPRKSQTRLAASHAPMASRAASRRFGKSRQPWAASVHIKPHHTLNTYMAIHNLPLRYHAAAGTGTGFGPRSRLSGRAAGGAAPVMAWAQTRLGCCWSAEPNRDGLSQQEIVQGQIGLGGDKTALWSLAPHRSPTSNCREVEAVIRRKMGERGKQEDRRACDVRRATDARSRKSTTNARPHALFGGGLVNPAH